MRQKRTVYAKRWRQRHPAEDYLFRTRARARREGIEFNLTMEDFVIPEFCPVFPWIRLTPGGAFVTDSSPSIDRIDPSKGYVKGNTIITSWRANNLKKDADAREAIYLAMYIVREMEKKNERT